MAVILFAGAVLFGCSQNLDKKFIEAVKNDNCPKVTMLLKKGVNVNKPETPGGWSALHFAAMNGSEQMVKILLDAGANPNVSGASPGQEGQTILSVSPLMVAQMQMFEPDNETGLVVQVKDPKILNKYDPVCKILEKAASQGPNGSSGQ